MSDQAYNQKSTNDAYLKRKDQEQASRQPPEIRDIQDLKRQVQDLTVIVFNLQNALAVSDSKISSNIPDGVNIGDMLYWNGSQWTLLSAPGSDSVMLFDFSGTGLPIWQTLAACP